MANYQPVPAPANTVVFGKARFVLLSDRMLRMEWADDGRFEDRATLAVVHRATQAVRFTKRRTATHLHLETNGFSLEYTEDGKPFSAANLRVTFKVSGRAATWIPGMKDKQNLGATIRTLDGNSGARRRVFKEVSPGKWEPTSRWKPVDLGSGFLSRSGWSLIDDSANIVLDGADKWVTPRPEGIRRDWYLLVHGHDYKGALADAALVFGRQPLPPRFVFGYWWSRYWAYTDREIEALAAEFDSRRIPLDIMVVDMDWHKEGWTGYSWDRRYFPDPDEFLARLKKRNLKITLNLHPADGVARFEDAFPVMGRAMGADIRKTDRIPMDITDRKYMDAYFRILHHPHEKKGIDFWWMDWQQGSTTAMSGLDPLPWINMLHWRDMETNPARRGKRPLIFSRFGGLGANRYCIGFSGDTHSIWESLQFQPHFTATAANVLYGYWSHDIGGHMHRDVDPELYARWVQFGIYSPVLRTHTSKNAKAERRVWAYPDPYAQIMTDALRLRYEMIPYIYTEARAAFDTGVSLCRPLYYEWPDRDEAYRAGNQYMFGRELMVAPVLKPVDPKNEMAEVELWLPPGRWFDTAHGAFEKGGRTVRRHYLASEIPVFVRPGAVLPGQGPCTRVAPGSYRHLTVTAYPGGDGSYRLYEDDGESVDYERNRCAWIPVAQRATKQQRTISVGPHEGRFTGFEVRRSLELRLPGAVPPTEVRVGRKILKWAHRLGREGWTYDGYTGTVIVRIAAIDLRKSTEVIVTNSPGIPASAALGLKGLLARLERVSYYNRMATTCLVIDGEERLGADLEQAGNRISRAPSTLAAERKRINRLLPALVAMLGRLGPGVNAWEPKPNPQRKACCAKALALLKMVDES